MPKITADATLARFQGPVCLAAKNLLDALDGSGFAGHSALLALESLRRAVGAWRLESGRQMAALEAIERHEVL